MLAPMAMALATAARCASTSMDPAGIYGNVARPVVTKLGTSDIEACETTPVVLPTGRPDVNATGTVEELHRFECVHGIVKGDGSPITEVSWSNTDPELRPYLRFTNLHTGAQSPPFGFDHILGCAFYEDETKTMFVFATNRTNTPGQVSVFYSTDGLLTWTQRLVIDAVLAKLKMIFNTSVHRGKGGKQKYIMAIESGLNGGCCGPITFAQSEDLLSWDVLDPVEFNYGHTPAKYTGDPTIRYVEPYYYMMHSEQTDERWVIGGTGYADFIVRSRNLSAWEESLCSDGQGGCPWLHYAQPGDKEPQNRFMPRWQQERLATSRDRCNSDIDLVTYENKTIITYSWGDQLSMPYNHIAMAEWGGGGVDLFLASFFPATDAAARSE